jgi:hypothetical protein
MHSEQCLSEAMNNAYSIINGELTFDSLFDLNKEIVYCAMSPDVLKDKNKMNILLEDMIEYYILTEEYEKCEVLKNKIK